MIKKALITGITGQDGSYLAEHLLDLGYEVHGIVRRVALEAPLQRISRIRHIESQIHLHNATLESYASLFKVLNSTQFDEVYHLAAQSFVAENLIDGFSTLNTNVDGTHNLLSAVYETNSDSKFYFAGTSEMFGLVEAAPQSEDTRFHPRSPYGISKVAGYHLTRAFREVNSMFCCTGILYNHESPRRGHEYVTRKITRGVARIKAGLQSELSLGNLDAARDWGFAGDFVKAMHAMLQQEKAEDFVIATGETRTVREFCEIAFSHVGLNYEDHVVIDERFYRPREKVSLIGDAIRARTQLGWEPEFDFESMVKLMVDSDFKQVTNRTD